MLSTYCTIVHTCLVLDPHDCDRQPKKFKFQAFCIWILFLFLFHLNSCSFVVCSYNKLFVFIAYIEKLKPNSPFFYLKKQLDYNRIVCGLSTKIIILINDVLCVLSSHLLYCGWIIIWPTYMFVYYISNIDIANK